MSQRQDITITVNGEAHRRVVECRRTLADFLRQDLQLTGTHLGCEHGVCGACAVLLNGQAVRACLMFAVQANGQSVTTVEGLTPPTGLSSLQERFCEHHALQCGFCTPGMVVTAEAILRDCDVIDERSVREAISGNICRCTGYQPIVEAILDEASRRS